MLVDPSITLVFYIWLYHLERIAARLISEGRRKETPATVISKISFPEQKIVKGNLFNIYQKSTEEKIEFPALLIIGEVLHIPEILGL